MKYVALDFDYSGENNRTIGTPIKYWTSIEFDRNGLPHFIARRNHPRVLQQPYDFSWYGKHNDIQQLLINATGTKNLQELGRDEYERFLSNILSARMGGLENFNYAKKYIVLIGFV